MLRSSNADLSSKIRSYTKKYFGNYLGIVVQNNDPDKRGKVKVFIPHISPSVYKNWISSNTDLSFNFPGKNINSDLSLIIQQLKEILPWAECAAPLTGATGSGRYNAFKDEATISDSNKLTTTQPNSVLTKYSLNKDNIGEKPARKYEITDLQLTDAFNSSSTNKVNKFSKSYIPSSYSNCAKGSFSIPNVGSHVWVFFREGNPMYPVYFAVQFGDSDWKGIFDTIQPDEDGIDYPGAYENKSSTDIATFNHNVETYRNKFVFSQKGGTLEIVNTDNREILKWTHFSGSFLEMNNNVTVQLATGNDQKLVLADQFLTVKGFKSEYIARDFEQIVAGDFYKKIGTFNRDAFTQWKGIVASLAEIKQLFEIKRTNYFSDTLYIKKVSPSQSKSPNGLAGHILCPICSNSNRDRIWNNTYSLQEVPAGLLSSIFTNKNNPSLYVNVKPRGSASIPDFVQPNIAPTNFLNGGNCPCCGGNGISPSSQGGTFDNQDKDTLISSTLKDKIAELAQIEKQLGLGGSEIINITKHKIETIGLLMNDFPSIRVDPVGKINNSSVQVLPGGVINNQTTSPLIELVHVDDLPGGSYNLNVCNRYNVLVGAGGISLKTYGPVEIGGTIVNLAGEQVNIVSENEINIASDKRLTLVSESIILRQKNYGQVLVDSNLGVSQNAVFGGSVHIDGELSIQHITAPAEIQETETTVLEGWITPDEVHAKIRDSNGHKCHATGPIKVNFIPHSHLFVNVPLNLTKSINGTRKVGQNCNKNVKMPALPVVNAKKIPTDLT